VQLSELKRLFAACGLSEAFGQQEALFLWPQTVGPNMDRLTEPQAVSEGILYVRVSNHTFAHECTLMRQTWLALLNTKLRQPLSDIRFKVAPLRRRAPQREQATLEDVELDAHERSTVERSVAPLEDERTKKAFRRLFDTYQKVQKFKAEQPGAQRCPGCGLYHEGDDALCAFCRLEGKER